MKPHFPVLIATLCFIWQPCYAQYQNSSSNYIEPGYQLTPILGAAASFIEMEAGRQLSNGISFGGVVHFMVSDIQRTTGDRNEQMSSLWYVGPRVQFSSALNDRLSFFGGSTFGIGSTNYHSSSVGLSMEGGFVMAVRPEIGVRYQLSELVRINAGVNVFYGSILQHTTIDNAPALRVGLRLGR